MPFKRSKKIMLKYSAASLLIEALGWILLAATLVIAVSRYPDIERFPTGFSPEGEPLGWTVREVAMVQPIIAVIVYVVLTGLGVVVRRAAPPDTPCPRLSAVLNAIQGGKAVYLAYALGVTWCDMSLIPPYGFLLPSALALCAVLAAACAAYILRLNAASRARKEIS